MRVPTYLTDEHVTFETIVHAPAFTAQKRAKVLHLPGKQVAKCVLLGLPDGYVLAVLPATHQVDTQSLSEEWETRVRLADSREITKVFPACEWGVLTPFGTLYGLPTILDGSIDPDAWMVFESHTRAEAIRMRCRDFERLEKPRRLRFAVKKN